MENLKIYNLCREVPQEAQKSIEGGRLKGMTDINPMWRIKKLTELYGPVGIGWYTEIVQYFIETSSNNERAANVIINLYVKVGDNDWSKPIIGIGGSMFSANEKAGVYTSDEAFKMAYTDAISVACKALGMGADIYFQKDRTKYDTKKEAEENYDERNTSISVKLDKINDALMKIGKATTKPELTSIWNTYQKFDDGDEIKNAIVERRRELAI